MPEETIEQVKERLKRQDAEKERAFQKRLKEFDTASAQWRAEKEEEERERERSAERLIKESREKRIQEMKDGARISYLDAGGTEAEFEKAWPEIKAEMLKQRTLEGEERARADSRRRVLQEF